MEVKVKEKILGSGGEGKIGKTSLKEERDKAVGEIDVVLGDDKNLTALNNFFNDCRPETYLY